MARASEVCPCAAETKDQVQDLHWQTALASAIHIDCQYTFEKISVTKAKHSFFALRVAPDLSPLGGGRLENSAGDVGETATFGKPAKWCGYSGRRAGHNVVEGIAVMNHPKNPWKACPWFTCDYGHLSPSPFNFLEQPWELHEGNLIRLRYRVVLHSGTPQEAGLDRIYRE